MNPIFSRSKLLAAFLGLMLITSCTDYGKKVTFTGHKGEVYYKSEGVTESDAKNLGKFLEDQKFFASDDKKRSVQVTKKNGRVEVRFVIDEKGLAETKDADEQFAILGALMSKEVFNKMPVDIIYTDDSFKDKKTIAFSPKNEALEIAEEIKTMKHKDFNNNTLYYDDKIPAGDAEGLVEYFKKSGFFTEEGNNDLLVNKKENDDPYFRFSVKASYNNEDGLKKVDDFVKQMKTDLFANNSLAFEVLDENLKHIKTFNY